MKMTLLYGALVVLIIGGLIMARSQSSSEEMSGNGTSNTTPLDTFAQCISDAGAKFYGAYWCPHCQDQKKLFKNSKKLPYIECSTPNGQGVLPICIDAKITGYPTWDFADGSRKDGEMTLQELSDKTSCALPQT